MLKGFFLNFQPIIGNKTKNEIFLHEVDKKNLPVC